MKESLKFSEPIKDSLQSPSFMYVLASLMIKKYFTNFWSELNFVTINGQIVTDVLYGQTRITLQPVFDEKKCFIVLPIK